MNEIYSQHWNPLHNFFLPSMKLKEKARIGAKVKKKYEIPKTPYERLMPACDFFSILSPELASDFVTLG
jgi:hypothetical protein